MILRICELFTWFNKIGNARAFINEEWVMISNVNELLVGQHDCHWVVASIKFSKVLSTTFRFLEMGLILSRFFFTDILRERLLFNTVSVQRKSINFFDSFQWLYLMCMCNFNVQFFFFIFVFHVRRSQFRMERKNWRTKCKKRARKEELNVEEQKHFFPLFSVWSIAKCQPSP